jgi:hypothetical protein
MKFPKSTTASRRDDRLSNQRWLHVSCKAYMGDHPLGPEFPAIPYIQRPGITYDVGRNKAKREKRAAKRISQQSA